MSVCSVVGMMTIERREELVRATCLPVGYYDKLWLTMLLMDMIRETLSSGSSRPPLASKEMNFMQESLEKELGVQKTPITEWEISGSFLGRRMSISRRKEDLVDFFDVLDAFIFK